MGFQVICDNCGFVGQLPASFFGLHNATNVSLEGNLITCPNCGAYARIQDGVYDVKNGIVQLVKSLSLTNDELFLLKNILEKAKSDGNSQEAVLNQVQEVSPQIAGFFRTNSSILTRDWLSFLFSFIALLISLNKDVLKDDDEKIEKKVIEYLLKENAILKQQVEKKPIKKETSAVSPFFIENIKQPLIQSPIQTTMDKPLPYIPKAKPGPKYTSPKKNRKKKSR